jgi:hypothetical protein
MAARRGNAPDDIGRPFNNLLRRLSASDFALIAPHLAHAEAKANDLLYNPGANVEIVHFPCGPSLASYMVPNEDGRDVETILVGREGAVGGIVSEGYLPAYTRIMVKFGGPFVRLYVGKLNAAKSKSVTLSPCTRHLAPIHPRSVAAVEHFPCQALEGRVSDISPREGYSWHLNSTQHRQFKHETGNRSCSKVRPRIAPRPTGPTGYIRPPTLKTPILPRQSRLSIGESGRIKSHLFWGKRPINRLLGFGHRRGLLGSWPAITTPATDADHLNTPRSCLERRCIRCPDISSLAALLIF